MEIDCLIFMYMGLIICYQIELLGGTAQYCDSETCKEDIAPMLVCCRITKFLVNSTEQTYRQYLAL